MNRRQFLARIGAVAAVAVAVPALPTKPEIEGFQPLKYKGKHIPWPPAFDDYEEGLWTPTFEGAQSMYYTKVGKYVRISNTVHIGFPQ